MTSRKETERAKLIQDKCQTLLNQMLRDEDNKYCVDCDAKGPRWASWNLGVFLCIRCAGIHRNLGVHISRVKSVNLDSWTPEQVVSLQQMGNSRARAVYEAQLPDGFRRPQTDSALESFIRAKYEHKKYLAREWVPPSPPKVDWAKEIDEEIEKQKRKKKSTANTSLGGISGIGNTSSDSRKSTSAIKTPLPAPLPKPKSSSSPKTNRQIYENNSNNSSNNSNTSQHNLSRHHQNSDLLGLSSPVNSQETSGGNKLSESGSGDGFSSFLSASSCEISENNGPIKTNDSLAKEEEDFFKQSNAGSFDKSDKSGKLSKDSILALYGTASNNNLGQFNNSLVGGFNNAFNHPAVAGTVGGGQFMTMSAVIPSSHQSTQNFPGLHQMQTATGAGAIVSSTIPVTSQFGGTIGNNLNLNLAGMPQGFLGPPQPHPQAQFMNTPTSVTSMYNAPVMTAPGAFTSAIPQQQIIPQSTFAAQFVPQQASVFGGIIGSNSNAMQTMATSAAIPGNLIGNSGLGNLGIVGMPSMHGVPTAATTGQPTSNNLSQQFGNLNLGNVWQ